MKKLFALLTMLLLLGSQSAFAESKEVLDLQIKETLQKFNKKVPGAEAFLNKTEGYLVIPNLYKAGFIVGGE